MKQIIFVTGNENKLREARELLSHIDIVNEKVDLDEYQGTPTDIATKKAEHAFEYLKKPCFVEDTSLSFEALGGMPGAYVKDFVKAIGGEKLPRLLDGFENKNAIARTTVAYHDGKEIHVFVGETEGSIKEHCGIYKFDWDAIFSPNEYDCTYAELTSEQKNEISQRGKAFEKFKEFLS